jgi:hypothetical protein
MDMTNAGYLADAGHPKVLIIEQEGPDQHFATDFML